MYTLHYFDINNNNISTISPQFPDIQTLVNYINQHPEIDAVVFHQNNYNHRDTLVAARIADVILNGKPRRKFVKQMAEYIESIPDQIQWKPKYPKN
jgi:hypothetical protein